MTKPRPNRYVLGCVDGISDDIYGFRGDVLVSMTLREAQIERKRFGRPDQIVIYKLVPVRRKVKAHGK